MSTLQKTHNKTLSNVGQTKEKITQNRFIGPFHYSELTLSSLCEIVGEKSRNCYEFLFFIPGYCLTFENEQVKNRWVWNWNTYYSSNSDLVAFLIHSSTFIPNKTAVNPLGLLVTICFIDVKPPSYAMKRKNGIRSRYSSKLKGTCFFANSVEIIKDQEKVPSSYWTVPQLSEFIHQNKQNGKLLTNPPSNPNMGPLHDSSASVQSQTHKVTKKTQSQQNTKYVIQSKQFRIKVGKNLEEGQEACKEGDEEEGKKTNLTFKRNKKNPLKKKSKKLNSQNHGHHHGHSKRHHNKNNKNKNKNHKNKNKKKINNLKLLNRKRKHKKFKRSTKTKSLYSSNSSSMEESGSNSNSQSEISDLQTNNKSDNTMTDTYSNIESESSLSSQSTNSYLNSSSYSNLNSESNSISESESGSGSGSESDFGLGFPKKKNQKKRKKKLKHKHKYKHKQKQHKHKQKMKKKQKQKEKHKHKQSLNKFQKKKRYRKKKIKREKQKKKKKKTNRVQITNSVSLPNLVLFQQDDGDTSTDKDPLKNKSKKNKDDENQFYNSDPEIQDENHDAQNNFFSFLKNSKRFIKQNKSKTKSKDQGQGEKNPSQEQLDHFMRKKSILLSIWEKCGSEQFLKTDFHSNNEKALDANLFSELSISDKKKNQSTAQVENSFSTQSILYSLSNEPCLSYSTDYLGDFGFQNKDQTYYKFRSQVLYLETAEKRFELSFEQNGLFKLSQVLNPETYHYQSILHPTNIPMEKTKIKTIKQNLFWGQIIWSNNCILFGDFMLEPIKFFWCKKNQTRDLNKNQN
ncbi:cell wall-binding protein yoch [Anaeramoeba flamelloides]|uniref:Cell wall-binding protein yoch n=1 Tax=Anaeramoeba flamelloides TaxID=1746091 RepID=A0AAV7ZH71_9EUKA|nr:cell wall-binding protein yoch [Anaeramoeba flamelloides]